MNAKSGYGTFWILLKDCGFEYITDESRDFLIFNTNDFHADTKALHKIKRITGMTRTDEYS